MNTTFQLLFVLSPKLSIPTNHRIRNINSDYEFIPFSDLMLLAIHMDNKTCHTTSDAWIYRPEGKGNL